MLNFLSKDDQISPTYISNLNYKFLEIDNKYYSTIILTDYPHEYSSLLLENFLDSDESIVISIFLEKKDKFKTIKELTHFIGTNGVYIDDSSQNVQDYNLLSFSKNDALYIRRQLQINNEELFDFYIYINIKANSKEELDHSIEVLKTKIISKGLNYRVAYFRQKEGLVSTIPIGTNPKIISEVARRNILSSSIDFLYPFLQTTIIDKNGILYGTDSLSNTPIFINKFNKEKYKNHNTIIFGASGSGKSYFAKLNILREWITNKYQYIIDAEKEYTKITNILDGEIIKVGSNNNKYVNILDIYENSYEFNYLENKLHELKSFFYLLFPNISEYEYSILEKCLIKAYENFGISFDDSTFYKKNDLISGKEFKSSGDMPLLEDVYNFMNDYPELKEYTSQFIPFINGSLSFFNKRTNIKINNKLILADISDIGEENYKYGVYIFSKFFWEIVKNQNRENYSLIYIDEIWKLIGVNSTRETAREIYKMFKTIRKYNAGITAITQDISDLFSLQDGAFGKSILNNTSQKILCNLDLYNINELKKYLVLFNKEIDKILTLKKGESLLIIENQHVFMKIISTKIENAIITGKDL